MEVEFGWGGWVGGGGGGGVQSHFHVKPNSVEVVLRLSCGCDKSAQVILIVALLISIFNFSPATVISVYLAI